MLYRIFTEDTNRSRIEELCSNFFDAFTLISAQGFWKGNKENSLIVEVVDDNDITDQINNLALAIKRDNKQEAMLIQKVANSQYLL